MNLSKSLFFFNFSYKNLLFFIVIALNYQKISSQDFQAFTPNILEENSDLLEDNSNPNQENENNKNNKKSKFITVNKKKINEENYNSKFKYAEEVRNPQIINGKIPKPKTKNAKDNNEVNDNEENNENNNITELPKIATPLFTQNEKKVLGNILPEKEIKKYEKRFEFLDKEKNNLLRKHAFETKKLEKERADLEKKFNTGQKQLENNQNKNKILEKQISDQENELKKLKSDLETMKYDLRNKWTEFELKKFRKDSDNNTYHYRKEDFFPEEETKKKNENKENDNENEKKDEDENTENKDTGFKVTILEGNIGENIIDTSSKIIEKSEEGGLEELD